MSLTLEELRADLVARWKGAFERLSEVKAKLPEAVETVFTQGPAYALTGYALRKFKAGARVSKKKSSDGDDYVFRLDAQGRPLHVRYAHRHNRSSWQGVYHYRQDEVECLEFCLETGVPNLYNRLILSGESVVAEQRFVCNMGGTDVRLKKLSSAAKSRKILGDPHAYFIYLTRYHVDNGLTKSAEEYQEVGGEIHRPTLEYSYAADGKLQRILQHWPGGEERTVFAAKTQTTVGELSERLSEMIAVAVLSRLRATSFDAPLTALELSYRELQNHIPKLVPLIESDRVESLALPAEIDPSRWLSLSEQEFAPEIVEFNARVEATDNSSAVAKMLRAAARRVTERAPAELRVADGFVAYAIDWELEGDEIAKILKQCGATPKRMQEWKKKGWL